MPDKAYKLPFVTQLLIARTLGLMMKRTFVISMLILLFGCSYQVQYAKLTEKFVETFFNESIEINVSSETSFFENENSISFSLDFRSREQFDLKKEFNQVLVNFYQDSKRQNIQSVSCRGNGIWRKYSSFNEFINDSVNDSEFKSLNQFEIYWLFDIAGKNNCAFEIQINTKDKNINQTIPVTFYSEKKVFPAAH